MITRLILFTASFVFSSFFILAGDPSSDVLPKKQTRKQIREALARKQILQLKENTLLVRLHFNQKSIDALRNAGKEKRAIKYSNKYTAYNLKIVTAFKNYFHFCPVQFFNSEQSQLLIDGELEKITFLDSELQPLKNYLPLDSNYFIGEFHYTERDTAKYFSHYSSVHNESFKNERVENYYGSMERGLHALIIKNNDFEQLARPFPYNVKVYRKFRLHIPRSPEKVVIIMNRKLQEFFSEQHPNYLESSVK